MPPNNTPSSPSSTPRWALLLFILVAAAFLRFYQLGEIPPGLYRDEAWNGLDALNVLKGNLALFFPANNGREPTYIYIVAMSIALFGRTALAIRLGAALISTLTTLTTYKLGQSWFGWRTGLFSAWLWAVTVWPIHLGRIGFRAVLLPFYLSLIFWLGTEAYRRPTWWRWLLVGLVYGLSFYTYLAVRFTPVLLLAIGVYVWWRGRGHTLRLAIPWFSLGTLLILAPFLILIAQQPELISGRAGQVSILNPDINSGNLWGAIWQHTGQALGLFFVRGDTILRHNPPGRPLFDLFMLIPFLIGLWVCWQTRHRGAIVAIGLWISLMLGPTILAEDTPHFLRAVGILPAAVLLPALGLSHLSSWTKLPPRLRLGVVIFLSGASAVVTGYDYFWQYAQQPETAYFFEAAAQNMAESIQAEAESTVIFVDQRLWEGWPSLRYFLDGTRPIHRFQPETGLPITPGTDFSVYLWPFAPHEFLYATVSPSSTVTITEGEPAQGDLEPTPLPFMVHYTVRPMATGLPVIAQFGETIQLRQAEYQPVEPTRLQVQLIWTVEQPLSRDLKIFVHVLAGDTFIGQWDAPTGQGYWARESWLPGLALQDQFNIVLSEPFDPVRHTVWFGVYDSETLERVPLLDENGTVMGDQGSLP